jgi:hypothetical protein
MWTPPPWRLPQSPCRRAPTAPRPWAAPCGRRTTLRDEDSRRVSAGRHEARVALLAQRIARGLEHHHARHVGERLRARAARCVSAAQQHTLRPHARASLQVGHM